MKKSSNNNHKRLHMNILVLTFINAACVEGAHRITKFFRKSGDVSLPITCAADAQRMDDLAIKYNAANSCENLGWKWGHTYDGVSTYFEKQYVVLENIEPIVLGGAITLPILFNDGAYIDMYIEFTSITFLVGEIRLMDSLQDNYDVYDNEPETLMISMEMFKGKEVIFKTWRRGWTNRAVISPFPFTTGIVYKVTFKALGNELQVLVDGRQFERYAFEIHSSNAKQLYFSEVGMLLHKIEFVA